MGPTPAVFKVDRLQPLTQHQSFQSFLRSVNLDTLKSKVIADSGLELRGQDSCNRAFQEQADWYPSFKIALNWLSDSSLVRSQNRAIILISDGGVARFHKN